MQSDALRQSLESLSQARPLLHTWSLRDFERGWQNLSHLAEAIGLDALRELLPSAGAARCRAAPIRTWR